MRTDLFIFSISLIFLAAFLDGCAVETQKVQRAPNATRRDNPTSGHSVKTAQGFAPTAESRRAAILSGQRIEYIQAMEALAADAASKEIWAEAAEAYKHASMTARAMGQLQKAIAHGNKAVDMAVSSKDPRLQIDAMRQLAFTYSDVRQFEKEREWLEKTIAVSQKLPEQLRENYQARLYGELGRNALGQGEAQRAIEYLSDAVLRFDSLWNWYRKIHRPNLIPLIASQLVDNLNHLGNAYLRDENISAAIKTFERGVAISKALQLPTLRLEAELPVGLGRAYLAQGEFSRATENFSTALQVAETRRVTSVIEYASSGMGEIHLRTGRPKEAVPFFAKAIDTIENTRSQLGSEEFRTSFFENKGGTYGGIIQAQLASKNIGEAFDHNERARSRAFLDILGSKVQLSRQGTLVDEEKRLQSRINALRAIVTEGRDESEEDGANPSQQQELEAAEKTYADFLGKVRKESKEQASLMNVEPLSAKQVQELLDPGISLLEYFITNDAVILWVVDNDAVNSVSIPLRRKDLQSKVTSFRQSISQLEELGKLNQQAQELYKLLIEPALPHIRGKELLIIPHDVLHYLPFQALLAPDGQYLIEKYPINYLSSASLMQFTQEKGKARGELTSILAKGGNVLTFGNPDLGDPKMSLAFAGVEAKEIKSLYPQSTVYLETEATEERAKSLVGSNDIVHFASHAELSEDDPLSSAILLAKSDKEDGRLEVREIFGMDLKASLVVLSACETGLGKLSSGDELVGLTRAFIYAGTPSVVASLWNVEDSSTAQLMASFYRNLKTMTKVEALRQAQLQLIQGKTNSELLARRGIGGVGKLGETAKAQASSPDTASPARSVPETTSVSTSHPYFWAPFILVGEGK